MNVPQVNSPLSTILRPHANEAASRRSARVEHDEPVCSIPKPINVVQSKDRAHEVVIDSMRA
jgi:hypothetical protein